MSQLKKEKEMSGLWHDAREMPERGKLEEDCPDAPRYKACGNSMCVNVMRWIGMRIDRVDKMEGSDEQ